MEYRVEEDGYVRVEVKNDDPGDVYFDDLRISFSGLQVLEENHLYPYGKQQQEASYVIDGAGPWKHGFQGEFAEKDKETGLTNFDLRMYSGEIGRWLAPDPYGQYSSPYVGMGNNPVNSIDPDGGFSLLGAFGGAVIGGAIGGSISAATGGDFWEGAVYGAAAGFAAGGLFGPTVKWQGSNAGANHTLQMKLTWNTPNFSGLGNGLSNGGRAIGRNAGPIASAAGNAGLQIGLNGGHGFAQLSFQTGQIDNGFDILKAITEMENNALRTSIGACAKYVRWGLEAGGITTTGHPVFAKNYGSFLQDRGFGIESLESWMPFPGDIVVMDSFQGKTKNHPYGHIQMYNGSQWYSDFKQKNFWPGSDYRKVQPNFRVYRWWGLQAEY